MREINLDYYECTKLLPLDNKKDHYDFSPNTYLQRYNHGTEENPRYSFSLKLFHNPIINIFKKHVEYDMCDHMTATTKRRINQFSNLGIFQKDEEWYYHDWKDKGTIKSFGTFLIVD